MLQHTSKELVINKALSNAKLFNATIKISYELELHDMVICWRVTILIYQVTITDTKCKRTFLNL